MKGNPGRVNQTLIINTKIFLNRYMERAEKNTVIFQIQENYRHTTVNNFYQKYRDFVLVSA